MKKHFGESIIHGADETPDIDEALDDFRPTDINCDEHIRSSNQAPTVNTIHDISRTY